MRGIRRCRYCHPNGTCRHGSTSSTRLSREPGVFVKVLLADDHHLIIEGVKLKLLELDPDVEIIVAMDIAALDAALASHAATCDLALVDIGMPGVHRWEHVSRIREQFPALPLVVLSGSEDLSLMQAMLAAGARAYIPKAHSPELMLSAIRLVLSGGVDVPPALLEAPVSDSATGAHHGSGQGDRTRHASGLHELLTERQVDVMRLLAEGKPNKVIARDLGISEGTVKIHLAAIFRALNVRNRVEAVIAAGAFPADSASRPGAGRLE